MLSSVFCLFFVDFKHPAFQQTRYLYVLDAFVVLKELAIGNHRQTNTDPFGDISQMFTDIIHLFADLLDLDTPPLLFIDNCVYPQRQITLKFSHACVGFLHLLSDRLIDGLRLLHLFLKGSLEVLDLLVNLIQEF